MKNYPPFGFVFRIWLYTNLLGSLLTGLFFALSESISNDFFSSILGTFFLFIALALFVGLWRSLPALLLTLGFVTFIVPYFKKTKPAFIATIAFIELLCPLTFYIYFFRNRPEDLFENLLFTGIIGAYMLCILLMTIKHRKHFFTPLSLSDDPTNSEQSTSEETLITSNQSDHV